MGRHDAYRTGHPRFTLVLSDPSALRTAFTPPLDLNPGKAYVEGVIDIEGNAEAAVDAMATHSRTFRPTVSPRSGSACCGCRKYRRNRRHPHPQLPGRMHSRVRDAAAIGFHYDQPVSFYVCFLAKTSSIRAAITTRESKRSRMRSAQDRPHVAEAAFAAR